MSMQSRGGLPATGLAVFTAALATGLAAPVAAWQSGQIWSYPSDGSWIPEVVSIGNQGTQVFTELGAYTNETLLMSAHDADPPAPVWTDLMVAYNFVRRVDSADRSDLHVSMHQVYIDGSTVLRKAVLRAYRSSGEDALWSYEFPVTIGDHPYTWVAISRDGSRVVGAVYDTGIARMHVKTFASESGAQLSSGLIDTFGAATDFAISGDATTAVFVSPMRITVVDLAGPQIVFEKYLVAEPNYGAIGLSEDGRRFAFGSNGRTSVYERGTSGYSLLLEHALPQGAQCRRLALSDDGRMLAMGLNFGSTPSLARAQLLDVEHDVVVVDHTIAGAGSYQNLVSAVDISGDGERFAVGLWGDENGLAPELSVYQRGQQAPIYYRHLPGSVLDLDMAGNGARVAVAHKGTHATQWGGGGAYRLFQVVDPDLWLVGVPKVGTTVQVHQEGRPGDILRLLSSPSLSDPPLPFPGVGELQLDRNSLSFQQPEGYGPDGSARYPIAIPNDSSQIGTTRYYQGLCLTPRSLSEDMVAVTVLP